MPGTPFTKENAAAMGRRGGIASGKAKRKRKTERERFQIIAELAIHKGTHVPIEDAEYLDELAGANVAAGDAIALRIAQKALNGDLEAARLFYNIIGAMNPAPQIESEEIEDDGLIEALKGTAAEDWSNAGET